MSVIIAPGPHRPLFITLIFIFHEQSLVRYIAGRCININMDAFCLTRMIKNEYGRCARHTLIITDEYARFSFNTCHHTHQSES